MAEEIILTNDVVVVPETRLRTGDHVKIEMFQVLDGALMAGPDPLFIYTLKNGPSRTVKWADLPQDEKDFLNAMKNKYKNFVQLHEDRIQ